MLSPQTALVVTNQSCGGHNTGAGYWDLRGGLLPSSAANSDSERFGAPASAGRTSFWVLIARVTTRALCLFACIVKLCRPAFGKHMNFIGLFPWVLMSRMTY